MRLLKDIKNKRTMRRNRPAEHVRRVNTLQGKKKVVVNPGRRKKVVRKRVRLGDLKKVTLFHGTQEDNVSSIMGGGLKKSKGMFEPEKKHVYLAYNTGVALGHANTGPEDAELKINRDESKPALLKVTVPVNLIPDEYKDIDTNDFWAMYQLKLNDDLDKEFIKSIPITKGHKKFLKDGGAEINDPPTPYWASNLIEDQPYEPIYNPMKKRTFYPEVKKNFKDDVSVKAFGDRAIKEQQGDE